MTAAPEAEAPVATAVDIQEARPEEVQSAPPPARFERPAQPNRERDRNWGNRDRGRGNDRVPGMGDHLPDFIALSFDERRGGPPRPFTPDEDESEDQHDPATADDAAEANTVETVASDAEAPKPKRRRRKKTDTAAAGDGADKAETSEAGAA